MTRDIVKRLVIQCKAINTVHAITFTHDQLETFAQAVIENYKASLVPVAWYKPNGGWYGGFVLHNVKAMKHINSDEYTIELFALPSGETK